MLLHVLALSLAGLACAAVPLGGGILQSASNPALHVRHCNFQLYAVNGYPGDQQDFNWTLVPAVNGAPNAVSFESTNYAGMYLAPCNDATVEPNRLCLLQSVENSDASFAVVAGLSDPTLYSFKSLSTGPLGGSYFSLNHKLIGGCASSYGAPSSDVVLDSAPAVPADATWAFVIPTPLPPLAVTVDASAPTHVTNPLYLGCHSDSGFTHQARGFYSQMVFGEVFEYGLWPNNVSVGSIRGTYIFDHTTVYQGFPSLTLSVVSGNGFYGLGNRGLGNEGLFVQAGKEYEGYFFAQAPAGTTVTAAVRLTNSDTGAVLAQQLVNITGGGGWAQIPFSFTTVAGTECVGIAPGSDPSVDCGGMGPQPGHVCVKCFGQFEITLTSPGQLTVNYFFLQPGQWARLPGLPVLSETVQWLQDMGITAIRQGGSFTQNAYYEWKNWRGVPYKRPSIGSEWGASLVSGWGPFEMIDLCNAVGFEPIITTSMLSSAQDFSDLVEYMFGDASTEWGATRIADGHPSPYKAYYFELGNEQYNTNYVEQVAAMEAKAASLGMPNTLYYMFPSNGGPNAQDAAKAEALGLKDHVVSDIHVGASGGMEAAIDLFASNPSYQQGAVNCETNPSTHDFTRALQEAMDLNDFFNTDLPRMHARTASFCTERSGHYDAFDQGLVFFLPNMTWGQPPFYVHKMITQQWAPNVLNVTANDYSPSDLSKIMSAGLSDDGKTLVLRIANPLDALNGTVTVVGKSVTGASATQVCLQSDDMSAANTPANPTLVSPGPASQFTWNGAISLPRQSYCILTVQL